MRPGLILAACGLAAGAALFAFAGQNGLWLAGAMAVVLLAGAAMMGARSTQTEVAAQSVVAHAGGSVPAPPPVLRDVLEQLPDPLMLLDQGGRVAFANAAMRAVVGTDAERKHVSAVLRTPSVLQAIDQTTFTNEPATVEFVFHVPVERHYLAYVARTAHSPELTTVLLHDLTALKRAEQARADFIANASHELRTPLAAVAGFIDTLRGHARDDEAARTKFLEIMNLEAQRMRRLIDDLLSLTRIEQNEHVPPSGEVEIEDVVRDAAATLGALAEADNVTVAIEAAAGLPEVAGERDELIQVFQNLIHNAIKYGKTGGHVWITLSTSPSVYGRRGSTMVRISIRDDGEGIPREAIPRLTERFYRVDVKRSRERGGTGLGLAIVKHIINRHQGRLVVESRLGEGSTFTVLLPARAPALSAPVTEVI